MADFDFGSGFAELQLVAIPVVVDRRDVDADTHVVAIVLELELVMKVASAVGSTQLYLAWRLLSAMGKRIQGPREEPIEYSEVKSRGERPGQPVVVQTRVQIRRSLEGGSHNLAVPSSKA